MPDLKKFFFKFNREERGVIETLIEKIISLDWHNLDIKRLKGHKDIFRVRKGNFRIIYNKDKNNQIYILAIERRSEKTYRNI